MKKYLLGVFAVLLAVAFTAFTLPTKKAAGNQLTVKYALFNTNGTDELNFAHYTLLDTEPTESTTCPSTGEVCYFEVTDEDFDLDIDEDDFNERADDLDTNDDGTIHDNQTEGVTAGYFERS